ncbi:MAG: hypothetical protein Q9227_003539 [Pyrenula ochraceoflavens]
MSHPRTPSLGRGRGGLAGSGNPHRGSHHGSTQGFSHGPSPGTFNSSHSEGYAGSLGLGTGHQSNPAAAQTGHHRSGSQNPSRENTAPPGTRAGRGHAGRGFGGGQAARGGKVGAYRGVHAAERNTDVQAAEDRFIKDFSGSASLARLSLSASFPLRPCFGNQGDKILLWANYFELRVSADLTIFRYDVDVTPKDKAAEAKGKKLQRIIQLYLQSRDLPPAASDFRKFVYTRKRLEEDQMVKYVQHRFEDEAQPSRNAPSYRVRLDPTGSLRVVDLLNYLNLQTMQCSVRGDVVQALNTIMGHYAYNASDRLVHAKNRIFDINNAENISLGANSPLNAIRGYFKSVRPATKRLLMNVNVSHVIVYKPLQLDELMIKFRQMGGSLVKLDKFLGKVRIQARHLPDKDASGQPTSQVRTICGIADPTDGQDLRFPPEVKFLGAGPADVTFCLEQNGMHTWTSVQDYFRNTYRFHNIDKKHPVVNIGTHSNPRYLPAEACRILPGQICRKKLSGDETRIMLEFCCRTPAENAYSVERQSSQVLGIPSEIQKHFDIDVLPGLISVMARVLAAPSIAYKDNKIVKPNHGGWDFRNMKMASPSNLKSWTYLEIQYGNITPTDNIHDVMAEIAKGFRNVGMTVSPPKGQLPALSIRPLRKAQEDFHKILAQNIDSIETFFREKVSPLKLDLLFVILPDEDAAIYNAVKTLCDTEIGVHTMHMVRHKLMRERGRSGYIANVALKANLKLGGTNQILPREKLGIVGQGKTMMVGIDVTHPSPNSLDSAPSVAAVVANVDSQLGQWPATIELQSKSRQEMVSELGSMVLSRLQLWRSKNNTLPDNIIIWRDGVSEGQYQIVLEDEVPQIRNACRKIYSTQDTKKELPRLTVVVAGKRHHTRFYPTRDDQIQERAKGNCPNGTVVDRTVTEVQNWDFYLQAHQALQGTARPAHYYVLLDEIFRRQKANPAELLEDLTHNLSYLFGRCSRAVSYCPAAYYADIVCERARRYLSQLFDPSDDTRSQSSGSRRVPTRDSVRIAGKLRDAMFYI